MNFEAETETPTHETETLRKTFETRQDETLGTSRDCLRNEKTIMYSSAVFEVIITHPQSTLKYRYQHGTQVDNFLD